jgi:hypothetical protein
MGEVLTIGRPASNWGKRESGVVATARNPDHMTVPGRLSSVYIDSPKMNERQNNINHYSISRIAISDARGAK